MASYPAFKKYERNGLNIEIGFCAGNELSDEIADWATELLETNMGEVYQKNFGMFSAAEKRKMLVDPEAR